MQRATSLPPQRLKGVFSQNLFKATLQGEIASSRRNRLKGVFSQNLFKATLQGKTRLFKAKSPGALQGKIAWRPSRRNRLAPFKAKSPGALAWGCRVRLELRACRPLAPIWGRCSLRRRALAAVARVGVRSANDSQQAHTVVHAINSGRAWGCRVRLELRA